MAEQNIFCPFMSHCRFENTHNDLQDCYENMDNDDLSNSERNHKKELIQLCINITQEYGFDED